MGNYRTCLILMGLFQSRMGGRFCRKERQATFKSQKGMGSKVDAEIDWLLAGGEFLFYGSHCVNNTDLSCFVAQTQKLRITDGEYSCVLTWGTASFMQDLERGEPNPVFAPLIHHPTLGNIGEAGNDALLVCSLRNVRAQGCFPLCFKPVRERLHVTTWDAWYVSPGAWGSQAPTRLLLKKSTDEGLCGVVGVVEQRGLQRWWSAFPKSPGSKWFCCFFFFPCGSYVNSPKNRWSESSLKEIFSIRESGERRYSKRESLCWWARIQGTTGKS